MLKALGLIFLAFIALEAILLAWNAYTTFEIPGDDEEQM